MIAAILGGAGLFLLGMVLLTEGIKAVAGDALRRVLSRMTGGPLKSVASGVVVTTVVQSSSATTLTTIGFVSAGLLTLPQAIGVIFGANVGTTGTAWLVSLLGLKFSIGAAALPVVGVGALLRLLARGRAAHLGLALAGFGLIFLGIDTLQSGMQDLGTKIDLSRFPGASVFGRLTLVIVGAVLTVVMQSSSAALATTLTALHGGTIDLLQAAALVIGANLGTTLTAGLAGIGATVPAKRTALAHILFNAVTGAVALLALRPLLAAAVVAAGWLGDGGDAVTIAAFHTVFNVLGVALLLPVLDPFARLVARLVPERGADITRNLDASVARVPAVAIEATRRTALEIASVLLDGALQRLRGDVQPERVSRRLDAADAALAETRRFLADVHTEPESPAEHIRHLDVLHAIDHLDRLAKALRARAYASTIAADPVLVHIAASAASGIESVDAWLRAEDGQAPIEAIRKVSKSIAGQRKRRREEVLQKTAAGAIAPDVAAERLDALRWLDRVAYHVWRMTEHLAGGEPVEPEEAGEREPKAGPIARREGAPA